MHDIMEEDHGLPWVVRFDTVQDGLRRRYELVITERYLYVVLQESSRTAEAVPPVGQVPVNRDETPAVFVFLVSRVPVRREVPLSRVAHDPPPRV